MTFHNARRIPEQCYTLMISFSKETKQAIIAREVKITECDTVGLSPLEPVCVHLIRSQILVFSPTKFVGFFHHFEPENRVKKTRCKHKPSANLNASHWRTHIDMLIALQISKLECDIFSHRVQPLKLPLQYLLLVAFATVTVHQVNERI